MEPERYNRLNAFFFDVTDEKICMYAALLRTRTLYAKVLESLGGLVLLDFAVTGFTSATYRRRRLRRPSGKSYLGGGFALRCFQRLS